MKRRRKKSDPPAVRKIPRMHPSIKYGGRVVTPIMFLCLMITTTTDIGSVAQLVAQRSLVTRVRSSPRVSKAVTSVEALLQERIGDGMSMRGILEHLQRLTMTLRATLSAQGQQIPQPTSAKPPKTFSSLLDSLLRALPSRQPTKA